jgi:hypothetical protein
MMNQHDRDNLNFLMTASDEVLREWYSLANEDDLIYAQELLSQYEMELDLQFSGGRSFSQVLH